MNYSPKHLIQLIEGKRFRLKRVTGSLHLYFHKELIKTVVVPVHRYKDIPIGTYMSIIKQAGISKDEL